MNVNTPPKFGMGAPVRRVEDKALITGNGSFTDDIQRANALHAYVVRSPHAHAKFTIENASDALAADGVHLVLTHADIAEYGEIPCQTLLPQVDGTPIVPKNIPLLCKDSVHHLGDAVAFVVADTLDAAQAAAELIEINYDILDATVDTEASLAASAPLAHTDLDSNQAFELEFGDGKANTAVFETAARVTQLKLINNRLVANYLETRACLAEWSDDEDRFTLTTGSQGVHGIRSTICEKILNIDHKKLRVITPDVGGGFGTKVFVYREHPLTLIAAKLAGKPVKWTGDRSEHFISDAHGRDNVTTMRMAMDEDGKFLAVDIHNIAAMGAYLHTFAPFIPTLGASIGTGVYDIASAYMYIRGVYTNTVPTDAYRGAGRPEAIYALERLVDQCAFDLGVERDEIRRRNMIKPEQMPYTTSFGRMYDTGEYEAHMDQALSSSDWAGFEARNQAAKDDGKIRGIGFATYVEACAFAGSEPATINLNKDGTTTILIGTQSNGQGHKTAYAQFAAETLGLDIEKIDVRQGDTDELSKGGGTGGSRSIPLGAVSVQRASDDLAIKIKAIAADKLEASTGDLELVDGAARIVGTDREISFASIAEAAENPEDVSGFGEFKQEEATYPNGTHVCEIEIDPETGVTQVVGYTIVDDFGVTVNPILLAGQVHGGVVQAIGQCLMEKTVYDEDGQLLSATLMDYQMPRAADVPFIKFDTRNVPSTTNAMGIKGAGEAGTIGAGPAVMSAVVDALKREYGITHIDMPATPLAVWQAIQNS
jgi:carbon-monoxide dehydrogenase large subunit